MADASLIWVMVMINQTILCGILIEFDSSFVVVILCNLLTRILV